MTSAVAGNIQDVSRLRDLPAGSPWPTGCCYCIRNGL